MDLQIGSETGIKVGAIIEDDCNLGQMVITQSCGRLYFNQGSHAAFFVVAEGTLLRTKRGTLSLARRSHTVAWPPTLSPRPLSAP